MSDDPDDFQAAFWAAKHALATANATAFARHGIHQGQQFVLRLLWAEDGLTPGEIANRLGLATSTITRAATRMEAAGLLRRQPHPTDRRLVRLRLTDRGRGLEQLIETEIAAVAERAMATVSPADQATFVQVLQDLKRNLEGEARNSSRIHVTGRRDIGA